MDFLSDLWLKPDTVSHAPSQRYLKVNSDGKVVGTTNVEETDPTVPSYVKAITSGNINQWGQAYSWGDHAGQYVSNKLTNVGYTELFSGDLDTLPNGSYVQAIGGASTNGASGIGTPRSLISFGARSSGDSILQSDILIGAEGFAVRNRTNNIWRTAWHSGNFNPNDYQLAGNYVSGSGTTNYLPKFTASDTIGDSALFEQNGGVGVSTNAIGNFALRLARPIGGASNVTSAINTGKISSGVSVASIWGTGVSVSDSAAIGMLQHFTASGATLGTGSAVSLEIGFHAEDSLGTNSASSVGFYGTLAYGTNKWNLFMEGAANNYLEGALFIGTPAGTNTLDVNGTARIRTINNLGTSPTSVLVPSATGVLSLRTLSELMSDMGVQPAGNYVTLDTTQTITGSKVIEDVTFGKDLGTIKYNSPLVINLPAQGTKSAFLNVSPGSVIKVHLSGRENGALQPIILTISRRSNSSQIFINKENPFFYPHSNDISFSYDNATGNIFAEKVLYSSPRTFIVSKVEILYGSATVLNGSLTETGEGVDQTVTRIGEALSITKLNTIANGSITAPSFIKSGGLPTQFLKADGSVDSNIYATQSWVTSQNYQPAGSYAAASHTHANLTTGTGLTGSTYNGGTARAFSFDTTWGDNRYSLKNHTHDNFKIKDVRNEYDGNTGSSPSYAYSPQELSDRAVTSTFAYIAGAGSNWRSALAVKGWTSVHLAWELIGPANTSATDDNYYLRSGVGSSWNTPVKIWHSGNFDPSDYQPTGSYLTSESDTLASVLARGNSSSKEILLTATGTNTTVSVESLKLSGFGLMGNRGTMYLTNNNASGAISIGFGGNHSAGIVGRFSSSGLQVTGEIKKTGGTSSQFLKADGSVDSTSYQPAGSYASSSHTHSNLTAGTGISGSTYNGGTARTWSFDTTWGDNRYQAKGNYQPAGSYMLTSHVANTITSSNISNWNLAYTWGDHSQEGYITITNVFEGKNAPDSSYASFDDITGIGAYAWYSGSKPADGPSPSIRGFMNVYSGTGRIYQIVYEDGVNSYNRYTSDGGTTWSDWVRMWHSGNFTQNNIDNWNTAYSWGNHSGLYALVSRSITAGNGLSGGGTLAANRTITLGTPGAITLSSTNSVGSSSHTHEFNPGGTTSQYIRGDGSLATYANTTYSAGTLALLQAGTNTSNRVWSAKILSDFTDGSYAPAAHTHSIADITGLEGALGSKAGLYHTHNWDSITDKPDFNNKTQRIQIDGANLSGTGTIEAQVATYINANIPISRSSLHSTLFVEITDYDPGGGDPGGGGNIPTNGLKLYYNFEGSSNWYDSGVNDIKDFSPEGVNGTMSGGNSWTDGGVGGYLQMRDSYSHWINTNQSNVDLGISNNDFTIILLMRVPDASGQTRSIGTISNAGPGTGLQAGVSNGAAWIDIIGGGMQGGTISANTWYHLAFTKENPGDDKIYINGSLVATSSYTAFSGDQMIAINRWGPGYYNTDLGVVMIYNRTLSASEISDIYEEQRTRFSI